MFLTNHFSRAIPVFLAITLCITPAMVRADSVAAPVARNMYGDIADLYAKSLGLLGAGATSFVQHSQEQKEDNKAFVADGMDSLSELDQTRVVFELFSMFGSKQQSKVLNKNVWKDLELFCGSGDDASVHLLSRLDRTNTIFGKAALAHILAAPISDIQLLRGRQALVRHFLDSTQSFDELDAALNDIAGVQETVLSFWKPTTDFREKSLEKVYWSGKWFKGLKKRLNKSLFGCEVDVRGPQLSVVGMVGMPPIAYVALPTLNTAVSKGMSHIVLKFFEKAAASIDNEFEREAFIASTEESRKIFSEIPTVGSVFKDRLKGLVTARPVRNAYKFVNSKMGMFKKLSGIPAKKKLLIAGGVSAIVAAVSAGVYFYYYKPAKIVVTAELERMRIRQYLQSRLIELAKFVRSARSISYIIDRTPELATVVGSEQLEIVVRRLEDGSYEFDQLMKTLDTHTFEGQPSALSWQGRVLKAHKLMESVKNDLVQVMEAVGRVDAYLSIAKLYQEHADLSSGYCFVDFVQESRPVIDLQGAWNPFIDSGVVVSNNIALGNDKQQNMIITGPNAGGKSTSLKSVMINALLAQSFGISPAASAVITPFSRLATHLNITDDISSGDSLFMAEAKRAKELVDMVNELEHNQFAFTLMDEIFSGTDPEVGARAGYKFAAQLGQKSNSISMIATHFPLITSLEQDRSEQFANYKVTVEKNEDGSIHYFYTLVPGISDQNIAMDILISQGVFA